MNEPSPIHAHWRDPHTFVVEYDPSRVRLQLDLDPDIQPLIPEAIFRIRQEQPGQQADPLTMAVEAAP